MKLLRVLLVAGLVLAAVKPASADIAGVLDGNTKYCGGTIFETCASILLDVQPYQIGGNAFLGLPAQTLYWTFTLTVENLTDNVGGDVFKTVGFYNMQSGVDFYGGTGTPPTGWKTASGGLEGPFTDLDFSYTPINEPPANGIQPTQSKTFTFQFIGLEGMVVDEIGVGIHSISGGIDGRCSTKLGVKANGDIDDPPFQGPYDPNCTEVIPEPGTIFLLGTGLAGLGIVVWQRRKEDEE